MRSAAQACLACLIVVLFASGCGPGDGQGLDRDGNLPTTGTSGAGVGDATLDWVQSNVFTPICVTCHAGAGAPMGVDWSSGKACGNVGRPSGEMNGTGGTPVLHEIEKGDPDLSYVIWKIKGAGPNGEPLAPTSVRMPFGCSGASCLPPQTIQNVSDWIAAGAPGC